MGDAFSVPFILSGFCRIAFLSNVWEKYRLMSSHKKSEQFDRKCQVRLNRARISAGGEGNLKWSKGDLQSSSKVLGRLPFLPLLFLPPPAPGPMLIKTLMFVRVIALLYPKVE